MGRATPLYFCAIESLLYGGAVLGPVKSIEEAVFAFVVADGCNLLGHLSNHCLVDDAVKLQNVLPVSIYFGPYLWFVDHLVLFLAGFVNQSFYLI